MDSKELQKIVLSFLATDAMLALGALLMGLAVNLFTIGEYLFSALFLVLAGGAFFLRTIRKVEKHLGPEVMNKIKGKHDINDNLEE